MCPDSKMGLLQKLLLCFSPSLVSINIAPAVSAVRPSPWARSASSSIPIKALLSLPMAASKLESAPDCLLIARYWWHLHNDWPSFLSVLCSTAALLWMRVVWQLVQSSECYRRRKTRTTRDIFCAWPALGRTQTGCSLKRPPAWLSAPQRLVPALLRLWWRELALSEAAQPVLPSSGPLLLLLLLLLLRLVLVSPPGVGGQWRHDGCRAAFLVAHRPPALQPKSISSAAATDQYSSINRRQRHPHLPQNISDELRVQQKRGDHLLLIPQSQPSRVF